MKVLAERGNEERPFLFLPSRTRWWIIRELPCSSSSSFFFFFVSFPLPVATPAGVCERYGHETESRSELLAAGRLQGCVHSLSRCFGALFQRGEREKKCVPGNSSGEARGTHTDRDTRRTRKPYRWQTSSTGTLFSWKVQRRPHDNVLSFLSVFSFLPSLFSFSSSSFDRCWNIYFTRADDSYFMGVRFSRVGRLAELW